MYEINANAVVFWNLGGLASMECTILCCVHAIHKFGHVVKEWETFLAESFCHSCIAIAECL